MKTMQLFAKFKKIIRSGFRATLNFRKVLETVSSLLKVSMFQWKIENISDSDFICLIAFQIFGKNYLNYSMKVVH